MSTSPVRFFDRRAFRDRREAQGLTFAELGRRTSLAPATLRHWESGRYKPSIDALSIAVAALGCHIAELLPVPANEATLIDHRVLAMVSSADAAAAVGLTRSGYSALERGEGRLDDNRAAALADLFLVPESLVWSAWERTRTGSGSTP